MIVTKKGIPRRTVLRGIGTTVALPLLDAMSPALTALAQTAATGIRRLGIVYHPHGMVDYNWNPKGVGSSYETSIILQPLAPFRDQLLIVSNLANRQADALGDGAGDHARASGGYLTGVHVKKSETNVLADISMDQIAARMLENETQLSSLQLTVDPNHFAGSCDNGYNCAYSNTLSWRTATMPLMSENDPRVVFERLFGASDSTDAAVRAARLRRDRSILDSVSERVTELQRRLGASDTTKVSDYLESLRDVERRIQKAEEQSTKELPEVERPSGVPDTFEAHVRLMYDLQLLAYQCDLTRVITFMYGREQSARTYPQLGVPDPHHQLSHHAADPEKLAKLTLVQTHHIALFGEYLEKLRTTPDGDGSLLDHMMILYGSGISNSDRHTHHPLPTLLLGSGGGIKGGRHLVYPDDTPLANLHLTLLQKMGVPVEKIGDSTGTFKELSELSDRSA
jgi:hypothetical protein